MQPSTTMIQPKTFYESVKSLPLTQESSDALVYLYQPIIGADALALYFALVGDSETTTKEPFIHLDLFNALNMGLARFLNARARLEGIGLLKVFVKQDQEFGTMFGYALQEPYNAQTFMQDEMYRFLLLNQVGERKFNQLVQRFAPRAIDFSDYEEVTQKFLDVYHFDQAQYAQTEAQLQTVQATYATTEQSTITIEDDSFDWQLMLDLTQRKFISPKNFTNEFQKKILLYQQLYGFDMMELVELCAQHTQLTTGMIDQKALEQTLAKRTTGESKVASTPNYSEDEEIRRFNTLRQNGYSEAAITLIKESEQTAPLPFAEAIKQAKKSYLTKQEEWLVRDLVERSPLPTSVINLLLHYILVVQNNSTLQQTFVNKIATNWSELGIKTPEAAIQHVRELAATSKQKQQQTTKARPSYQKQLVRKEKLPDWVENPPEEVADPKRQAELEQRMKAFLKEGEA